jgi:hypothetical protein
MPGQHFDIEALGIDRSAFDEAVRVLIADGNVIVIDPEVIREPFALGMLCVDIMKHGAKGFAQQMGMDQDETFQTILAGFMAELQHSTDQAGEPN